MTPLAADFCYNAPVGLGGSNSCTWELGMSQAGQLRPAVFLDRDGTLIEDRGHLRDASEVAFYPDAVEALRRLQEHFLLFLITNQSGVARGLIGMENVNRVNAHVVSCLAEHGVTITDVYVCPHQRSDGCSCIKPNPHFLHKAAAEHGVDLQRSFTIGDHPHDVQLARTVGARGIYVRTGHGEKHLSELSCDEIVVAGIGEAADRILELMMQ
jgi:D-glycero-D-manno-heptose 1,7-bisphosphate phosphatase